MFTHPRFRTDLEIFEQKDGAGHKIVVLKDPVARKYFRLSHYEYRFLGKLDGTLSAKKAATELEEAGYYYCDGDINQILARAAQTGLLLGTAFGTARHQLATKRGIEQLRHRQRWASVYFLFIPLINPDPFLERTVKYFNVLFNKWTAIVPLVALPGAVYLIVSGMPRIQQEFLFFFNLENLVYLWVTVAITKLAHEFSHAYTAKRFGLHVPEMGVAFLIFFPCLYCNTTEAWELADRRQRMAISAAGVVAEAVLAVFAAYVWYFSRPGVINSVAFYLMGVSLLSTLLINGNPLLKFDGYFLLADYLRLPNLYQKAFAYIRHLFMNRVLGISNVPDPARTARERMIFGFYGFGSFTYRIFLYLGIIAGVYYRFDKTLGIILAVLAFALFLVRPAWTGTARLFNLRDNIHIRFRGALVLACCLLLLAAAFFVPIATNSIYPCYLDAGQKQKIAVPQHTWVDEVRVREGMPVARGTVMFQLDTSVLRLNLVKQEVDRDIIKKELDLLLLDDRRRAEIPSKEIELHQVEDEIRRTNRHLAEAEGGVVAPFDGVVTKLNPKMKKGFQPGEGVIVGELESLSDLAVHALIPERSLSQVHVGQRVRVWFPVAGGKEFEAKVSGIRQFSEKDLSESPFSSRFGGELATEVRSHDQKDSPLESQYNLSVLFDHPEANIPLGMTGRLVVGSPAQSIAGRIVDHVAQTLNREALF
ncbi:MAG: efflux RND transporter periplasmic adaptor subunit [Desulfomonile tiedjei]|nr:efflux RND transporter periplasmic adaptor subunit [Desulfomonile tiedjei]